MLSKKAFEASQLVMIIIVIVSFMLIAGVVGRFFAKANDKDAEVLCHDSIALRAKTVININPDEGAKVIHGTLKPVPSLCKTIDKKIKGNREEIKQQLADAMARCWWMFGEGKYEQILSSSTARLAVYSLDEIENQCFVCYAAIIDEDHFEPIKSEEFRDYLIKSPYTKVKDNNYINYIQSYGGPGGLQILTNIEPRQAYGITFLAKNSKTTSATWLGGITKTLGGGVVAFGAGAACTVLVPVCVYIATVGIISSYVLVTAGYNDLKIKLINAFYGTERDVSMVAISDLKSAQEKCFSGDIAGQ